MASTRRFKISSNQSQPSIFVASLAKRATKGCAYRMPRGSHVQWSDKTAILRGLDKSVPSATCNLKWQWDGFSRCLAVVSPPEVPTLHGEKRSKRLGTLGLSVCTLELTDSKLELFCRRQKLRAGSSAPSINSTALHLTCATLLGGIGGVAPSHLLSCLRDPEREACPACPNETVPEEGTPSQVQDLHISSHLSAFAEGLGDAGGDAVRMRNSCVWANRIPGTTCIYGFRFAARYPRSQADPGTESQCSWTSGIRMSNKTSASIQASPGLTTSTAPSIYLDDELTSYL